MIEFIKQTFRKLTPIETAAKEMVEAELAKLAAQSAQEYAMCIANYNELRAKRLKAFILQHGEAPQG